MGKFVRVAAIATGITLSGVASSASAACIEFRESASGDAMLVNHCNVEMNVGYFVAAASGTINFGGTFYRSTVSAEGTKVLWVRDNGPVSGRYQVRVFSCMAPTDLIYPRGGHPTCQISYASEG